MQQMTACLFASSGEGLPALPALLAEVRGSRLVAEVADRGSRGLPAGGSLTCGDVPLVAEVAEVALPRDREVGRSDTYRCHGSQRSSRRYPFRFSPSSFTSLDLTP